ncbi:MAG TPA: hypothetical protein VLF21_01060 [Candidatus Saccharimonadales bacterium]|nr:hypothetical protein [Candidatus Saccharimonadales bacterium]
MFATGQPSDYDDGPALPERSILPVGGDNYVAWDFNDLGAGLVLFNLVLAAGQDPRVHAGPIVTQDGEFELVLGQHTPVGGRQNSNLRRPEWRVVDE